MKVICDKRLFSSLLVLLSVAFGWQITYASSIYGMVYDNQRNTLPDVDIELDSTVGSFRNHTRTDSTGRYEFAGLGDGRFTVRVLPYRYDLENQEQSVEISTVSFVPGQTSSMSFPQDFYLTPRKGSIAEVEASVVFAQEVPKEAKSAYENAIEDLRKKRFTEGLAGLQNAIKLFPTYFLALQRLGKEYVLRGKFADAAPTLIKAADVNNKSPMSFYLLGFCLHKLKYNKAAIVSLKQAVFLSPAAASAFLLLGTAERIEGLYADAEIHLKQAKKLSNVTVDPTTYYELAQLYSVLKRYNEAISSLESYLKALPQASGPEDEKQINATKQVIKKLQELAKQPI
jgi:tetratricopeptide (TPR) repeat protein